MLDLTDIQTIKTLSQKYKLWPQKKLGQNFLINRKTLETIINAGDLQPNDQIIEIGTGMGTLTLELIKKCPNVTSIELDQNLKPLHAEILSDKNVISAAAVIPATAAVIPAQAGILHKPKILYQNALDFQPPETGYKVIANIPYYITSPLLSHFLKNQYLQKTNRIPKLIILMIQKEVAEKLSAAKKLNILALNTQPFGAVELVTTVPKSHFYPAPQVDSAIVKITPYPKPLIDQNLELFFKLVHAGFAQKRKKLFNSLKANIGLPQEKLLKILTEAEIDPNRRAETLSITEWNKLTAKFELLKD